MDRVLGASPRLHKGKSLLCFPQDYVVIDIETTGLSSCRNEIIELGALRVRDGEIRDSFSSLVKPLRRVDGFITALTGITNEMLTDAPKLREILPDFMGFVGGDIVVGHNVNFDINFIYDACAGLFLPPFSNDYVDTMRLSRLLFKSERRHRLSDLAERLGLDYEGAHRALADVLITQECLTQLRRYADRYHGLG
ncbi:MAG: 3'-5' exonuclease [Clostridia bacterium]|nr:3'-5' exonuclease [Clostridia bacterium]